MVTNNNEKMQELTVEEKLQNLYEYKELTPRSIKSRLYGENYR